MAFSLSASSDATFTLYVLNKKGGGKIEGAPCFDAVYSMLCKPEHSLICNTKKALYSKKHSLASPKRSSSDHLLLWPFGPAIHGKGNYLSTDLGLHASLKIFSHLDNTCRRSITLQRIAKCLCEEKVVDEWKWQPQVHAKNKNKSDPTFEGSNLRILKYKPTISTVANLG